MSKLNSLILILAILGLSRAAAQDGTYYQPYNLYDTDDSYDEESDPDDDYLEREDENYSLGKELSVPGYDYEGYMVFEEDDATDDDYLEWKDGNYSLGKDLSVPGYDYEGYMVFEEDDTYYYGEEAYDYSYNGDVLGVYDGETGVRYDYYTDDWFIYEDSFSEWYDSLRGISE